MSALWRSVLGAFSFVVEALLAISGMILAILERRYCRLRFLASLGNCDHRRLSHRQPNRLSDWSGADDSWPEGPIKYSYPVTNLTIIQARVATRTLPANTSSKKRPHIGLFQRANDGSPFCRVALCEGLFPCRLIATLDVGNTLVFVSHWDRLSIWDKFKAMERRFPRWSSQFAV